MVSYSGGNVDKEGMWSLAGNRLSRGIAQEVVMDEKMVYALCFNGSRLIKTLRFERFDWPDEPDEQLAFLEERHPLADLENAAGGAFIAKAIIRAQAEAINLAREKFLRMVGLL